MHGSDSDISLGHWTGIAKPKRDHVGSAVGEFSVGTAGDAQPDIDAGDGNDTGAHRHAFAHAEPDAVAIPGLDAVRVARCAREVGR